MNESTPHCPPDHPTTQPPPVDRPFVQHTDSRARTHARTRTHTHALHCEFAHRWLLTTECPRPTAARFPDNSARAMVHSNRQKCSKLASTAPSPGRNIYRASYKAKTQRGGEAVRWRLTHCATKHKPAYTHSNPGPATGRRPTTRRRRRRRRLKHSNKTIIHPLEIVRQFRRRRRLRKRLGNVDASANNVTSRLSEVVAIVWVATQLQSRHIGS